MNLILIRAYSSDILSVIQENYFDLIYIDGSHYYEGVSNDIKFAKKLIRKKSGVICGDDLEILPNQSDLLLCKKNLERDYIHNAYKKYFHPGVMLAISEEFKEVKMTAGFWWIFFSDDEIFVNQNE